MEQELHEIPEWRKYWRKLQKKEKSETKATINWERHFLQNLIINFLKILENISLDGIVSAHTIQYCERFLELMIDLEALLPTRRFFNTLLDDCHLIVRAQICNLVQRPEGKLFGQVSTISLLIIFVSSGIRKLLLLKRCAIRSNSEMFSNTSSFFIVLVFLIFIKYNKKKRKSEKLH